MYIYICIYNYIYIYMHVCFDRYLAYMRLV